MAAGSIVIDLLMKTGSFETDTKRAEKRLAELKKEAKAMGVAVGAAFAAVGTASALMVKNSIDNMDDLSKQAQKVGASVEELSGLMYAADLSGAADAMGTALVRLSKSIQDGSDSFDTLGISVKNADGTFKSSTQVLGELADKFQTMPDGVEKTALAVDLLGRSGADLIPLLNGGSEGLRDMTEEARQLGVVIDTETAKAAEEFNDNLSRLGYAVQGVANHAASELLPALVQASDMFVQLSKDEHALELATGTMNVAIKGLLVVFQTLLVVGSDVVFVFQGVGREIGAITAQIAALARGDLSGFNAISEAVKEDAARARKELDAFQAKVMSIGQPAYTDPRLLGAVPSIAEQTRGWNTGSRPPAPPAPARTAPVRGSTRTPAAKQATSDRYDAVIAAQMELEIMNEAMQEWAKYSTVVDEATTELTDFTGEMTRAEEAALGFASIGLEGLRDMIVSGKDLDEVFANLLQRIVDLTFQLLVVEPIMESLRANMSASSGTSGIGSLFASIAGAFGFGSGSGVPPNPFAGGRAGGGGVLPNQEYWVGELGPERFVPRTAGTIVPASASGGRPVQLTQHITVGDVASVSQVKAMIAAGNRALVAGVRRSEKYGRA